MSKALSFLEEGNFHVPSFLELHIVTVSRCERRGERRWGRVWSEGRKGAQREVGWGRMRCVGKSEGWAQLLLSPERGTYAGFGKF